MANAPQFTQRDIAINGSAGAFVTISSTRFCRKVTISEQSDSTYTGGAFNPQGCIYQFAKDGYATSFALEPGEELILEDPIPAGNAGGRNIGSPTWTDPAGNSAGGTPLIKIRSATATASNVRVREYY